MSKSPSAPALLVHWGSRAVVALAMVASAMVVFADTATAQRRDRSSRPPDPAPVNTAAITERQQQLDKLMTDLSSPDVALRLATFEAALSSADATARQLAIQGGLSSTDNVMRRAALRAAFAGKFQVSIRIQPVAANPPAHVRAAHEAIGGVFPLRIYNLDLNSGAFSASSPYSNWDSGANGARIYEAMEGVLDGDRLTFTVPLYRSTQPGNQRYPWSFRAPRQRDGEMDEWAMSSCTSTLRLAAGSTMSGPFNCVSGGGTPFAFNATLDVLN